MTDNLTLRLEGGGSFTLRDDEKLLSKLGPAILSHLGCSYEIRWPDQTQEAKERRRQDRKKMLENRRLDAEAWAAAREVLDPSDREYVRELLVQAYIAGYDAAPKGVNSR